MAFNTKAKKGAAAPKSTIGIILDKLQPSIHNQLFGSPSPNDDPNAIRRRATLIANGEEALRVLQIKRASLIKDTSSVRAALVIDYLCRNAPNDDVSSGKYYLRTTIPAPALAKAAGLQKKDMKKLETMQTIIASYLDGASIGNQNSRKDKIRNQKRARSQPDASATGTASFPIPSKPILSLSPTNLIRDLCIQLGPMIPDAEFAVSYATRLFEILTIGDGTVKQSNSSSKRRFSRYELRRDMERHQEYYEAACFYLAVKKSEGESSYLKTINNKNVAKKNAKAASTKDEGGERDMEEEEEEDYGDDDRPLQQMDVTMAANLLEGTFKEVLDCVRDWTEGLFISLDVVPGHGDQKGHKKGETRAALFEVADNNGGGDRQPTNNTSDYVFEQWKQKVLEQAKVSAMKKMNEGPDSKDWLTIAADDVLRKAGLWYNFN